MFPRAPPLRRVLSSSLDQKLGPFRQALRWGGGEGRPIQGLASAGDPPRRVADWLFPIESPVEALAFFCLGCCRPDW